MFLFLRFRAGVKDLEVMVQNLISSAFDTITTVQEGVEILDIFQHLSSREVLYRTHFSVNNISKWLLTVFLLDGFKESGL